MEVYLVNGKKVNFEAGTFDRTDQVLEVRVQINMIM